MLHIPTIKSDLDQYKSTPFWSAHFYGTLVLCYQVDLYSNQGERSKQSRVSPGKQKERKIENWLFFCVAGSGIPECFHGCVGPC